MFIYVPDDLLIGRSGILKSHQLHGYLRLLYSCYFCFTYPFPLRWCLSLKWVSVDYRNMGMLINPFSYHLIISFNWRIINSYTYYWKLCVYWTHYCFCLCYFYIFISWTRKVRKEVMNDGKGALRKEWQYTGDKMGEIRKEWGL